MASHNVDVHTEKLSQSNRLRSQGTTPDGFGSKGMMTDKGPPMSLVASALLVLVACAGPAASQEEAQAPVDRQAQGNVVASNGFEEPQWRLLQVIRSEKGAIDSSVHHWTDSDEFEEFWATTGTKRPVVDFDSELVIALRALQAGSCLETVVDLVVAEGALTVQTGNEKPVSEVGRLNDPSDRSASACRLSAATATFFVAVSRTSLPGSVVVSAITPVLAGDPETLIIDTTES